MSGNLLTKARRDAKKIMKGGFSEPITLIHPVSGLTIETDGLASKHHINFDSFTISPFTAILLFAKRCLKVLILYCFICFFIKAVFTPPLNYTYYCAFTKLVPVLCKFYLLLLALPEELR